MYTYTHTYTFLKHFSMSLENFILCVKRRRETIIAQNGDPALRAARAAIAACNKQLPARLATSMIRRPHLVARLH